MERLPYEPRTLRELVEADLRRAARLVIAGCEPSLGCKSIRSRVFHSVA